MLGQQYSKDTTLQIIYKIPINAIGELKKDHKAVLRMIKKCTKTAKQFYNKISQE